MAKPPFPPKSQGLDAPPMIGGPSPLPPMKKGPPAPDQPDADDMGQGATPSPESVNFHQGPRSCGACEYMGADGNCAILKIPVEETDSGCNAFESKNEGGEDMMAPEGEEAPQMGAGPGQ